MQKTKTRSSQHGSHQKLGMNPGVREG